MATAYNEFKLIGPSDKEWYNPSAVTLSCRLSPEISAVKMEIRWFKGTDCVCVYKNRQMKKGRGYEDRVSLFTEELEKGNVSIQLRHCTGSELRHYLCQVTDGDRTEEITVEMRASTWDDSGVDKQRDEAEFYIRQRDRKLTENERMKIEKSALLTEMDGALKSLEHNEQQLKNKDRELRNREKIIKEKDTLLKDANRTLEKTTEELQERERALCERDQQLKLKETQIQETQIQVEEIEKRLVEKNKEVQEKNEQRDAVLMETDKKLQNATKQFKEANIQLETLGQELHDKKRQLQQMKILLDQQKTELARKNKCINEKESLLTQRETQLMEKDRQLQEKDKLLEEKTKQLQEQTDPESSAPIRRRNSKNVLPLELHGVSSSPDRVPAPVPELRLVLLGRTGSGKSQAGNTILSREERNQASTSTATQSTQGEVAGKKVSVVDTPDWFSPDLSLEKLRQDVGLCVQLSAPGPHAFLLIIPVMQPTGGERGMLEKVEEIFGETCWRNTMIIFTFIDELQKKNIEEFIQSGDQEIKRLVEKCGNKFHCLNIKENGDGSQVSELLKKIELLEGGKKKFYSSEIYLETESQIKAMETKILKEREDKRMREEMETKEKIKKEVQDSLGKIEGVIQEHEGNIRTLNNRTTDLERNIKEERDEEKKRELEKDLHQVVQQMTKMVEKVKKLKDNREREKLEMEERHQEKMEEIREEYEGEVRIEAERNLMKIILPELRRIILASKTKMKEDFSRQMEERYKELETLEQRLFEVTESHSLLKEAYQITVLTLTEPNPE